MKYFFMGCMLFVLNIGHSQPLVNWEFTSGSNHWDELHQLFLSSDMEHYFIAGNIEGRDGSLNVNSFGENDYLIAKTDLQGNILWAKSFGGIADDRLWGMIELANGDLLLAGASASEVSGTKTSTHYGATDYWLIRTNSFGEVIWQQSYGGDKDDYLFDVAENSDGTLLLVGYSDSDISGTKTTAAMGHYDGWVLKVTADGQLLSQQAFGGNGFDNLYTITLATQGGYILGGATGSASSSTITKNSRGSTDYYLVKIDEDGQYEWDTRYGGVLDDQLYEVKVMNDGNYLICGGSASGYSVDKSSPNLGSYDYWIIKMDKTGKKIWDKSFGGTELDVAYDCIIMPDGNIYVGGVSDSPKGEMKEGDLKGDYDYWLAYLDQNGEKLWDQTYGGSGPDALTRLALNPDYSLLMGGHSSSDISFDKTSPSFGVNDFWIVKTDCQIQLQMPDELEQCIGVPFTIVPDQLLCQDSPCDMFINQTQLVQFEYSASVPGTIQVLFRDWNGCLAFDSSTMILKSVPGMSLGQDTSIFKSQTVDIVPILDDPSLDYLYEWSNGATTESITVNETGYYALKVVSDDGCSVSDTIYICACADEKVYIANVFQPNGNLNNDIWFVQSGPGIVENLPVVHVMDFWGTTVFFAKNVSPNDKDFGWDGTLRDRPCPSGVYTYAVEIQYYSGKKIVEYGTVTIIR
jgi:gliding motility-associated-like protein